MLRPVDPASLADLPGYTPLELGVLDAHAVSPDGHKLAAVVNTSGGPLGGTLHLVDVRSWTNRPTSVTFGASTSHLTFDSEGKAVYWISTDYEVKARDPPSPQRTQPVVKLERYDLATEQRSVVATFPSWFSPWEVRQLPSSSRVVVYGLELVDGEWLKGPPHIFVVDANSRRVLTNLSLGGVRAGQAGPPPTRPNVVWPEYYDPGLGWDLERGLLYVIHADRDRVTVVDVESGTVPTESDIGQGKSALRAITEWLVPRAEAKASPGTRRQAVVSPDGSRLYVTGSREEVILESDGRLQSRSHALGLKIVDTADFTEVGSIDLPVDQVKLSPSGIRMVLSGFSFDSSSGENRWSGLHVADPVELTVLAHLKPDAFPWIAGFSPDGGHAYLGSDGFGLAVLDLTSGRITVERFVSGYPYLIQLEGSGAQSGGWPG
jgi:hypothetical protein